MLKCRSVDEQPRRSRTVSVASPRRPRGHGPAIDHNNGAFMLTAALVRTRPICRGMRPTRVQSFNRAGTGLPPPGNDRIRRHIRTDLLRVRGSHICELPHGHALAHGLVTPFVLVSASSRAAASTRRHPRFLITRRIAPALAVFYWVIRWEQPCSPRCSSCAAERAASARNLGSPSLSPASAVGPDRDRGQLTFFLVFVVRNGRRPARRLRADLGARDRPHGRSITWAVS
jgi:hypothetical protein